VLRRVLLALVCFPAFASAQAVDVRDLPPLPRVADQDVTRVAVVAATETEEDVVTAAAKRDQSLGTVASAVTVIPGDRLRRFGYRTVAEALRSVAGVYVVDDRVSWRVGIRGLQILGDFNTHVLVLIDGQTLNEPWNQYVGIGDDLPVSIDEVARIEVIRGPVSSVYGTNAFFGIINIVTRSAGEAPRLYGRVSAGTFATLHGSAGFALGELDRQVRGAVSALFRGGETLSFPELGETTSADGNLAWHAALSATWDGWFAQVRGYDKQREIAAAPYETQIGSEATKFIDRQIVGEVGYTHNFGKRATVTARAYASRYQFQDYLTYSPDGADFRDIGDSTWFGGELRGFAAILPARRLDLTAGVEVVRNDVTSEAFFIDDRDDATIVPTDFDVLGVYGEVASEPLDWLGVSGGLRFDYNSLFQENLSPRAALFLHRGEDFGLKLLYAKGFRYPSAYEAYFADDKDFIANPDLNPERIHSYEAVLWARPIAGLTLRLSGFRWDLDDIIELQDVEQDGMPFLQFQNITTMSSTGGELEASYRDTRGWLASASLTLASVERNQGADPAPNAPVVIAKLAGSTPLIAGLFHLSTELHFTGGRETRDPMRDAKAFFGWNVVLHLPSWNGVDATLAARNIIGTREEVPTSDEFDRDGGMTPLVVVPGEGRELFLRVGYSFR